MRSVWSSWGHAVRSLVSVPVAVLVLLAGLACAHSQAQAVAAVKPAAPAGTAPTASTPSKVAKRAEPKPAWNDLSPAQQHALAPLAGEWSKMDSNRKEKWLVIGNKYTKMTPAEQDRLQERMREWIKLTPAQRRAARESYSRAKKLDAEKKTAQWNQYQQLSEEQKKKLAQAKLPKHVGVLPSLKGKTPPSGQLPQEALEQPLGAPVVAPGLVAPAPAVPAAAPTMETR